jgi:type VI secretion system protein ImpC
MPKPSSFAKVEIDVDAEGEPLLERPDPDTPFRILILGDFSGRGNRGILEPKLGGRPVPVDRDNFEEVLEKLAPELRLPWGTIRFRELEDFHPDRIFQRLELFRALRETRERLSDRATFAAAAAALQPKPPAPEPPPPPRAMSLTDLVEETETRADARAARALDDFSALVRDLVAPHLVPGADPRQAEMVAKVDAAIGEAMSDVLHYPDFQALEAAWRGVFFLIRRLETDTELKVYLLDISKAELAQDVSVRDLRSSGAYRVLVEQTVGTPGGQPWAVVAGNFTFTGSVDDVMLLGSLGGIARASGAPFLAAASPSVVGCDSLGEHPLPEQWQPLAAQGLKAWEILRSLSEAHYLGLAMGRFLLRLPYGKDTDPTEEFAFEEFSGAPQHEHYLWGNPALACVCLLGQAFARWGWDLRPGAIHDIDGLPAHVYREDGESRMKPCAEALLTEKAATLILDMGIMPLLSLKDRDALRLLRFQSLADPPTPLEGRWAG